MATHFPPATSTAGLSAVEALIRTLEVNLTAFAVCEIQNGWRLKTGALKSVLLHFVLRGEGFLEVDDTRAALQRGSIIVVPPGTPKSIAGVGEVVAECTAEESCVLHSQGLLAFRACETKADLIVGCASLSVQLNGSEELFSKLEAPLVLDVRNVSLYSETFDTLLQELSEARLGSMVFAECLMKQITILLLRKHLHEYGPQSPLLGPVGDARLLRAVADVVSHPERDYSLRSLAAAAGMSRSAFAARFAQRYRQTPMAFVAHVRMQSAARLLRTSEISIACLAAAVGYASRSQFSRAFKAMHGVDPTAYRRRASGVDATAS